MTISYQSQRNCYKRIARIIRSKSFAMTLHVLDFMRNKRQSILDLNDLVTKITIAGSLKDSMIALSESLMPKHATVFLKGGSALTKLRGLPNTGDIDLGVVFDDPQDFTNLLFERFENLRTSRFLQFDPNEVCNEFTNFVKNNKTVFAETFLSNIEKLRKFLMETTEDDRSYIFKTYEAAHFEFITSKDYIPKLSEIESKLFLFYSVAKFCL